MADELTPPSASDDDVRARLAESAARVQEQRLIAERLRTSDLSVAERVKALGFDGETARIFDLVPMVHVAWADGKIQKGERESIMAVIDARGIRPGSAAFQMMDSLLAQPPPAAFLEETLAVLRELLGADLRRTEALVDLCYAVADAAGGFLGFGSTIDPRERELLHRISHELGERAEVWLKAKLGELT
jgi:tellurite resistance protein